MYYNAWKRAEVPFEDESEDEDDKEDFKFHPEQPSGLLNILDPVKSFEDIPAPSLTELHSQGESTTTLIMHGAG